MLQHVSPRDQNTPHFFDTVGSLVEEGVSQLFSQTVVAMRRERVCTCFFLTTVEMLPVFLCEAPLLALLSPSDRLQRTDNKHGEGNETLREKVQKRGDTNPSEEKQCPRL